MNRRLPLANYRHPDVPVLLFAQRTITAASFFAQAQALAAALPARAHVVNLCESRHAFMLGFAAALMRNQTTLLPPGRGADDRAMALSHYPHAYVLSDHPTAEEGAFDVSPFLAAEASGPLRIPEIDAGLPAVILFTSGSTGQPTPHAKTWRQLWQGAACLAAALDWSAPSAAPAVVGSVPPQHMFGLESTVMLPWYSGSPVHGSKPLFAADLDSALADCKRPAWWMTTPTHLPGPLQALARPPYLQAVLASTMSLPAPLAQAVEAAWQVPVLEIYGSTETGALALRRTAEQSLWQPLPGVVLRPQGEGDDQVILASGRHIEPPVPLEDRLALQADGRFLWLSRAADLIKIGGKRSSLATLNAQLAALPGVEDGVFFMPDAQAPHTPAAQRLTAFYVSATWHEHEVLATLRTRIDPLFLPRPLYRVAQLPRNANGKLPRAALAALLAQCKATSSPPDRAHGAESLHLRVPASHPALAGHFPGDPIVPGAHILSLVAQAIEANSPPGLALGTLHNARFHHPLRPEQECRIRLRPGEARVTFEVCLAQAADETLIASGQWTLGAPGVATP